MENVFTIETLAGKTITSPDYTILIFMLDMSKVQKVYVKRPYQSIKMTSYLEEVLTSNEMYMMNIFIINVVIKVQYDKEEG